MKKNLNTGPANVKIIETEEGWMAVTVGRTEKELEKNMVHAREQIRADRVYRAFKAYKQAS